MSMFTLAISCLTTSNLSWFTDLTFQVPMQYCSLQHWTWLPSPVTSATGRCFHFRCVLSFFLELFLHCSPVAYWAPTDLGRYRYWYQGLYLCIYLSISLSRKGFIIRCYLSQLCKLRSSIICHLQTGAPGKHEFKSPRVRELNGTDFSLSLKSWEPDPQRQEKIVVQIKQPDKQWIQPSFLFCSGSQWIEWCSLILGRTICSTQFTNSNANLFQKLHHRHTQISGYPCGLEDYPS